MPLTDLYEELPKKQEVENSNTEVKQAKRKKADTLIAASEMKIEFVKAPKRSNRSSAKSTNNSKSNKELLPQSLPTVSEQPSNSRRQRGRPPKSTSKDTPYHKTVG